MDGRTDNLRQHSLRYGQHRAVKTVHFSALAQEAVYKVHQNNLVNTTTSFPVPSPRPKIFGFVRFP